MPNHPPTPPHPKIIGAQRFFSRIRTLDIECPHCGLVYIIRADHRTDAWNPRTSVFWCNRRDGCERKYTLGVLAWPKGHGHAKGANTPPPDQVPGPRQLAQMRDEGSGWWLPDEYRHKGRPDPTNLTGEPDRPDPEDPIDLDLATTEVDDAPRCLECRNPYSVVKSFATHRDQFCSVSCENRYRS